MKDIEKKRYRILNKYVWYVYINKKRTKIIKEEKIIKSSGRFEKKKQLNL